MLVPALPPCESPVATLQRAGIGLFPRVGTQVLFQGSRLPESPGATVKRADTGLLPGVDADVKSPAGRMIESATATFVRTVIGYSFLTNTKTDCFSPARGKLARAIVNRAGPWLFSHCNAQVASAHTDCRPPPGTVYPGAARLLVGIMPLHVLASPCHRDKRLPATRHSGTPGRSTRADSLDRASPSSPLSLLSTTLTRVQRRRNSPGNVRHHQPFLLQKTRHPAAATRPAGQTELRRHLPIHWHVRVKGSGKHEQRPTRRDQSRL